PCLPRSDPTAGVRLDRHRNCLEFAEPGQDSVHLLFTLDAAGCDQIQVGPWHAFIAHRPEGWAPTDGGGRQIRSAVATFCARCTSNCRATATEPQTGPVLAC